MKTLMFILVLTISIVLTACFGTSKVENGQTQPQQSSSADANSGKPVRPNGSITIPAQSDNHTDNSQQTSGETPQEEESDSGTQPAPEDNAENTSTSESTQPTQSETTSGEPPAETNADPGASQQETQTTENTGSAEGDDTNNTQTTVSTTEVTTQDNQPTQDSQPAQDNSEPPAQEPVPEPETPPQPEPLSVFQTAEFGVLTEVPAGTAVESREPQQIFTDAPEGMIVNPLVSATFTRPDGHVYELNVYSKLPGETLLDWSKRSYHGDSFLPSATTLTKNGFLSYIYTATDEGSMPSHHIMIPTEQFMYRFDWHDPRLPESEREAADIVNANPQEYFKTPEDFINFIKDIRLQ